MHLIYHVAYGTHGNAIQWQTILLSQGSATVPEPVRKIDSYFSVCEADDLIALTLSSVYNVVVVGYVVVVTAAVVAVAE